MGKGDRLHNRVDLFAALFWALVIVQYLPTPDDPACRPGFTPPLCTKHVLIWL